MTDYRDLLLRAAWYVRIIAGKATPGPWAIDSEVYAEYISNPDGVSVVAGGRWGGGASVFHGQGDAVHIALWDPIVAGLVADLLETSADIHAHRGDEDVSVWSLPEIIAVAEQQPGIKLARAILREAA